MQHSSASSHIFVTVFANIAWSHVVRSTLGIYILDIPYPTEVAALSTAANLANIPTDAVHTVYLLLEHRLCPVVPLQFHIYPTGSYSCCKPEQWTVNTKWPHYMRKGSGKCLQSSMILAMTCFVNIWRRWPGGSWVSCSGPPIVSRWNFEKCSLKITALLGVQQQRSWGFVVAGFRVAFILHLFRFCPTRRRQCHANGKYSAYLLSVVRFWAYL